VEGLARSPVERPTPTPSLSDVLRQIHLLRSTLTALQHQIERASGSPVLEASPQVRAEPQSSGMFTV
jgi:hypothetical protein